MKKRITSIIITLMLVIGMIPASTFAAPTAILSPQNLVVNNEQVNCEKYSINGSNYFKLRDIAKLLDGTEDQFNVGWDNNAKAISITTGQPYTEVGGELVVRGDCSASTTTSNATLIINGKAVSGMSVYNIGGNNFFKLRDLGTTLGFDVNYIASSNTATIGAYDKFVSSSYTFNISKVPVYSGSPFYTLNDNNATFTSSEMVAISYEKYGNLDSLGRCTAATACIGKDLMPTDERESISNVTPTGWVNNSYTELGLTYLYNRCHLIGYQLTAENDNKNNLITGTRYLNIQGMLYFENTVANYIEKTGNHVLYRVTPIFEGNNLVASGVVMEAKSVEDNGKGVQFNVYCYNVQPGVVIDYKTGDNHSANSTPVINTPTEVAKSYIVNKNNGTIHSGECRGVKQMKAENKFTVSLTPAELQQGIDAGKYHKCGSCGW